MGENAKGTWKVILKNGKPYLRGYHYFGNNNHLDMMIWKAKTDKPYCKFMSSYLGLLYLDDDMKKQLREVLEPHNNAESFPLSPEEFAAAVSEL